LRRAGLEGAAARAKTGDARTTGANVVSDEDRSEPVFALAAGAAAVSVSVGDRYVPTLSYGRAAGAAAVSVSVGNL